MNKLEFLNKQEKLSTLAFIYELPKLIALIISQFKANSILVILEIIHGLGDAINSLITLLLCKVLIKNKHNIKQEKLEIIIGMICDLVIIIGLSSFIIVSLHKLNGHETSHNLNGVIIITIISIFCDIYFLKKQKEIEKEYHHILAKTELSTAKEDLVFDIIELISLVIAETNFAYMTPILCILVAVYAIYESIDRIREQYILYKEII